jgi:hypothetical protein
MLISNANQFFFRICNYNKLRLIRILGIIGIFLDLFAAVSWSSHIFTLLWVLLWSVAVFVGMLCGHHQDVVPITLGCVCPFNQFDLPLWVAVFACSGDDGSGNGGGNGGGDGSCNDSGGGGSGNDGCNNEGSDDGGYGGRNCGSGGNSNSDSNSGCGGGGGSDNNSKAATTAATMVVVTATEARTKMMATATWQQRQKNWQQWWGQQWWQQWQWGQCQWQWRWQWQWSWEPCTGETTAQPSLPLPLSAGGTEISCAASLALAWLVARTACTAITPLLAPFSAESVHAPAASPWLSSEEQIWDLDTINCIK